MARSDNRNNAGTAADRQQRVLARLFWTVFAVVTLAGAFLIFAPGNDPGAAADRPAEAAIRLDPVAFAEPALTFGNRAQLPVPAGNSAPAGISLHSEAIAPLTAYLSATAVASPDRRYVAYNSWREIRAIDPAKSMRQQGISPGDPLGRPAVRVKDLRSGTDEILADGAASVAWSHDNRIAFVRSGDYQAETPWRGRITVQAFGDSPVVWTSEAEHYVAVAWAGAHLVAYRVGELETTSVLILDGPGQLRDLGFGSVVAVSPDGTKLFVERTVTRPVVEVLDVASGQSLATLDLTTLPMDLGRLINDGDWAGDLIVAGAVGGLAVFRFGSGQIVLDRLINVDSSIYRYGIGEPRFASGGTVFGLAPLPSSQPGASRPTVVVRCDPGAGCVYGPPRHERSVHQLGNPSRPTITNRNGAQ